MHFDQFAFFSVFSSATFGGFLVWFIQVTKERDRLEQDQACEKTRENLPSIYNPSTQLVASQHFPPGSSYSERSPGNLRREENLRQTVVTGVERLGQHIEHKGWKGEAGSAGLGSFSRSSPSELYDSDSEEEAAGLSLDPYNRAGAGSGKKLQNMKNVEEGMNNLEVERQQLMILEKIKQEQENEKKSLELISKLSLEDTATSNAIKPSCNFAAAGVAVKTGIPLQFPPSQFPGLKGKRSNTASDTSERIAALKAAAVTQGTYVDTNMQVFACKDAFQEAGNRRKDLDQRADMQMQQEEHKWQWLKDVKVPSQDSGRDQSAKSGDFALSNASKRSDIDITKIAFKTKNLEKSKKREEEKGRRSRRNSEVMAEMDAERKLHANIIKERAAAQARDKLVIQREVVVAKEWEEASRKKELAEKARLAGTVAVTSEASGSKRSSRDKSNDKPTKEQRSKRWSSVGHGAKAKPSNPRSRRTSGK